MSEAVPGSFRVRQDLAWVTLGAGKYQFFGREALGQLLVGLLTGNQPSEPAPDLPVKSRVRVRLQQKVQVPDEDEDLGQDLTLVAAVVTVVEVTWTCSPPFQGVDGMWRVCVLSQKEPVLASQVEVVP